MKMKNKVYPIMQQLPVGKENAISSEALVEQLARYLLLLGAKTPKDLRKVPVIFSGETANYIANRGYDLAALSKNRR